jgi:hypothetical protein
MYIVDCLIETSKRFALDLFNYCTKAARNFEAINAHTERTQFKSYTKFLNLLISFKSENCKFSASVITDVIYVYIGKFLCVSAWLVEVHMLHGKLFYVPETHIMYFIRRC